VWKFLQTLFQEFYQKSQMWASTNYPMAEPRILDDFPSAVTLRERGKFEAPNFPEQDPAWKVAPVASTGKGRAAQQPSQDVLQQILSAFKGKGGKGARGGGRNRDPKGGKDGKGKGGKADAHTQRIAQATPAKGDGQLKIQGGAGWPTWVPRACWNYKAGVDCHYGDHCRGYCYLTKDKDKFKKP
jgi:hypothetical protein